MCQYCIRLHDTPSLPLSNGVLGILRPLELALVPNERDEDLNGQVHRR